MALWNNSLILRDRILTEHEKDILSHIDVEIDTDGVHTWIGLRGKAFTRPLHLDRTHHHHLNAILALVAWFIDSDVRDCYDYPVKHVYPAGPQGRAPV